MGVSTKSTVVAVAALALAWGTWGTAAELPPDFNLNATDATDQSIAWFPERGSDSASRPPAQIDLAASETSAARDPALIPLPPAAWTGMAGLVALAFPGMRRYLLYIVR